MIDFWPVSGALLTATISICTSELRLGSKAQMEVLRYELEYSVQVNYLFLEDANVTFWCASYYVPPIPNCMSVS